MSGVTDIKKPWEYDARVIRVIDGDTVELIISKTVAYDFGFNFSEEVTRSFKMRLRLHGIDTPEVYGVKRTSQEYADGKEASAFALAWFNKHCEKNEDGHWFVHIKTHDSRHLDSEKGKYHGRWVAEIWTVNEPRLQLNRALIDAGHDKYTRPS